MQTIEFNAKIKNGIIKIPEQYSDKLQENVKVILLQEKKDVVADKIDQLFKTPIKRHRFSPIKRDDLYERQ